MIQAQQYISVDSTELNMSRDWLKAQQLENGCFKSVGKVLHKGMKVQIYLSIVES